MFDIGEGVRVDTGFRAGAVVSADYDSLLAKVIAHAPTRDAGGALARPGACGRRRCRASARTSRRWPTILREPDFLAAATPTAYLDEHPDVLTPHRTARPTVGVALLLGAVFAMEQRDRVG